MGVPLMRTKTWAYAAGALFGGIAGAYYASFKGGTFPDDFFFNISVFILCMVILGGMGNIWGVIIGGGFLAYLNQEGLGNIGGWINEHFSTDNAKWVHVFNAPIDVPLYSSGIFGVILVLTMLFRPEGLIPSSRRKAEFHEGVHDEPLVDVQACSDLLVAEGVEKRFGGLVAVNNVDFTIPERAIVSLIGPNGAGKTTFFNMLTGVYKPTAGRIVFDGHDVTGKPPHAITERGIGRTFQNIRLFQQHDRAREHPRRHALPALRAASCAACCEPPGSSARSETRQAGARSCSSSPGFGVATRSSRATSRTATSGGSRSRVPSRPSRSSCSWTSRPRA